MLITRFGMISCQDTQMEIPQLDDADIRKRYFQWLDGVGNIQVMLPELNADQREFLMTGIAPSEWDDIFNEDC